MWCWFALYCLVNGIMIAINAGKYSFCVPKYDWASDGCLGLMGSHYIHHFTRTRLCNMFLSCLGPLTRRCRCQESFRSRRERTVTKPTASSISGDCWCDDTLSNVGEKPELSQSYLLNIEIMADICSYFHSSSQVSGHNEVFGWYLWGLW